MIRWFIPLLSSFLLWLLAGQCNHYLAPLGVYLYVGGLYVTFAALHLDFRHGLSTTLLLGLIIDAAEPVPFGTHFVLLGAAHIVLFSVRSRVPREEPLFGMFAALLANLGLFLALSFLLLGGHPAPAAAWKRLFTDLLFSQITLAVVAPWFLALQHEALRLTHPSSVREPL